jgi:hypothetical protein
MVGFEDASVMIRPQECHSRHAFCSGNYNIPIELTGEIDPYVGAPKRSLRYVHEKPY